MVERDYIRVFNSFHVFCSSWTNNASTIMFQENDNQKLDDHHFIKLAMKTIVVDWLQHHLLVENVLYILTCISLLQSLVECCQEKLCG